MIHIIAVSVLATLFTTVFSLPIFNRITQYSTCNDFFNYTCSKENGEKQSLVDSLMSSHFLLEPMQNSQGYNIEQKTLKQQHSVLWNSRRGDSVTKELGSFNEQCLNTRIIEFYNSPLISQILEVCGGSGIFDPDVEIQKDLVTVMVDLHKLFGIESAFSLSFHDGIKLNALLYHPFSKKIMNQLYEFSVEKSTKEKFAIIMEQILNFQEDINHHEGRFTYAPKTMSQSILENKLKNKTVDWYRYLSLSIAGGADQKFSVGLNLHDINVMDNTMAKFGTKISLGYLFFSAIEYLEALLHIRSPGADPDTKAFYSKNQCFELATLAKLPFYASYAKLFPNIEQQKAIESSGEKLKDALSDIVATSDKLSDQTKDVILTKLKSLKTIAQYPSVFKNGELIKMHMDEMNLGNKKTVFEQAATMKAADFALSMKLYLSGKVEDYAWFTSHNLDYKINMIGYMTETNAIIVKTSMQDEIFFNSKVPRSFQLLEWYLAKALASLITEQIFESQIEKDMNNREEFAKCWGKHMQTGVDRSLIALAKDNIYMTLALKVFRQYEKEIQNTPQRTSIKLQNFFVNFLKQYCGNYNNQVIALLYDDDYKKRLSGSLANFGNFTKAFNCQKHTGAKERCTLL